MNDKKSFIIYYDSSICPQSNHFQKIFFYEYCTLNLLGNIRIPVRGTGYHLGNVIYPITTDFSSIFVERRN